MIWFEITWEDASFGDKSFEPALFTMKAVLPFNEMLNSKSVDGFSNKMM